MRKVAVIATSREGTLEALRAAAVVEAPARVTLFARASQMSALPPANELECATVMAYEADGEELLEPLIPRSALVLIGGHTRALWPTPEQRLAERFSRLGYRVAFVTASRSRSARAIDASSPSCFSPSGDT